MASTGRRNNLPAPTSTDAGGPGTRLRNRILHGPRVLMLRPMRRHPRRAAIAALVIATVATIAGVARTGNSHPAAVVDPRTRVYTDHAACLLTDARGTTTATAGAAWSGMQQAAKTTSERTSTLPITGAQTLQSAETYLNTLALQGCQTIIGAGALPVEAVQARATEFPHTRFIVVTSTGTGTKADAPNVTLIPAATADAISNDVSLALVNGSVN